MFANLPNIGKLRDTRESSPKKRQRVLVNFNLRHRFDASALKSQFKTADTSE